MKAHIKLWPKPTYDKPDPVFEYIFVFEGERLPKRHSSIMSIEYKIERPIILIAPASIDRVFKSGDIAHFASPLPEKPLKEIYKDIIDWVLSGRIKLDDIKVHSVKG